MSPDGDAPRRGWPGGLPAPVLREGIAALAAHDAAIARAVARYGLPAPRGREPGFGTLLRAIVGQQISTAAAASIWARLTAAVGDEPDPRALLALDDAAHRAIGLSLRKSEYARDLAARVVDGRLDLGALAEAPDEAVIAALSAVRGVGRWSAQIYLLFALGRPDVFPAGDLGLREAMARLRATRGRPDEAKAAARAARWAPWRGPAAILLWHTLHAAPIAAGPGGDGPTPAPVSARGGARRAPRGTR